VRGTVETRRRRLLLASPGDRDNGHSLVVDSGWRREMKRDRLGGCRYAASAASATMASDSRRNASRLVFCAASTSW
jgi:hypothetical protein